MSLTSSLHAPTVHFVTPGEFDLRSLTIMGLSAKTSDNPIGEFGTGLKYAIATLLRHGQQIEITLHSPGLLPRTLSIFGRKAPAFRGKSFFEVILFDNGKETVLPFTTELGKKWELWMAYRELACNTLDEKGLVRAGTHSFGSADPYTIITVTGSQFFDTYLERDTIILPTSNLSPIAETPQCTLYDAPSRYLYRRGVRAYILDHGVKLPYTANLHSVALTEDRLIASYYTAIQAIGEVFLFANTISDSHLSRFIEAPANTILGSAKQVSSEYLYGRSLARPLCDYLTAHRGRGEVPSKLIDQWKQQTSQSFKPESIPHTATQAQALRVAQELITAIEPRYSGAEIHIANLENNALGAVIEKTIFIHPSTFDRGLTILAGTLYEEYMHLIDDYLDYTRNMQDALLNKLMTIGAELKLLIECDKMSH